MPKIRIFDRLKLNNKATRWFSDWFFGFIRRFSIRNRLIFFFLAVSLIPISMLGVISHASSRLAIQQKIETYSMKELTQTVQNLEMKLQVAENITVQFFSQPGV